MRYRLLIHWVSWKSWVRYRLHWAMRPYLRCARCKRLAPSEEIVGGCGWCDRCWDHAHRTDPALSGCSI